MESSFAQWLRATRTTHDLTQSELAIRIGCAPGTIRKLEAGTRQPSKVLLARILAVLSVPSNEQPRITALARPSASASAIGSASPPGISPPHTFPIAPLDLVGREDDLALLRFYIYEHRCRLFTLTGCPGIGKTRLAIALAADVLRSFPDGVWFVDLTPMHHPAQLWSGIARVLKLPEAPLCSQHEAVVAHLQPRRLLLILDNFEHLMPAASDVAMLLAACPHLTMLVTSRERLALDWEQRIPIAPLSLPAINATDLSTIMSSTAVQLFLHCARMVEPSFALTPSNAEAVKQLCITLDGLPLAIKLAAGRIGLLPPAALLSRIENDLCVLGTRSADVPQRHQTLQTAIGASYNLLDKLHQTVFRRLAVFVGGWTLSAGQAVTDCVASTEAMLELLAVLVDHHLISNARTTEVGEPRFCMPKILSLYGLEQLSITGELVATRQRHADYFHAAVEQAFAQPHGLGQCQRMARLNCDDLNIRAAFDWMKACGNRCAEVRLYSALSRGSSGDFPLRP